MKAAGTVVKTAGNLAIARAPGEDHPGIGAETLDEQLDRVGRVVDVFGPVDRPYLAVKPSPGTPLPDLLGVKLYVR